MSNSTTGRQLLDQLEKRVAELEKTVDFLNSRMNAKDRQELDSQRMVSAPSIPHLKERFETLESKVEQILPDIN